MSNFDIALGLSESALNQISDGFYERGKDTVYKGTVDAADIAIDWAALSAPVFSLSPPSLKAAKQVVATCDIAGKYPHLLAIAKEQPEKMDLVAEFMASATNGFSFTIPYLQLSFGSSNTVTVPLVARGSIVNANNVTKMNLLGVSVKVDGSVNQKIVDDFLIPRLTTELTQMLNAFQIPPLAIDGLQIGATNSTIADGKIVIFGNLTSNSVAPSIDGFSFPGSTFFALLGPNALQAQVKAAVGNKTFGPSGSVEIGIGEADYWATVSISGPQASLNGSSLQISMGLRGSAGAGVKIGCTHPSVGFDVYAEPSPTVTCFLSINGSSIDAKATSASSFGVIVNATGVAIILGPFVDVIGSAIGSAVTAAFSSQIISLASFPSIAIPPMPVHDGAISMTVTGSNMSVGNISGYLAVTGGIAIS